MKTKPHFGRLINHPTCPHCNKVIDGFTCLQGDYSPEKGDISVCAYCQTILEVTASGTFDYVSEEALMSVELPHLQLATRAVASLELWAKK